MAHSYDATAKGLLEGDPAAWLAFLHLPVDGPVRPIDSELSTITAAADRVLLVEGPVPRIVHVEFQAARDVSLAKRLLWYNTLIDHKHDKPVQSVAVLLRREADAPGLDGLLTLEEPDGQVYLTFRYRVMRVWEQPVDPILAGPLATLPLAAISAVPVEQLPEVLIRLGHRLDAEADRVQAAELGVATWTLMGLRLSKTKVKELFTGAWAMIQGIEESSFVQMWLDKGRAQERSRSLANLRQILLSLGGAILGTPSPEVVKSLEKIDDPDRITYLSKMAASAKSWDELLGAFVPTSEARG